MRLSQRLSFITTPKIGNRRGPSYVIQFSKSRGVASRGRQPCYPTQPPPLGQVLSRTQRDDGTADARDRDRPHPQSFEMRSTREPKRKIAPRPPHVGAQPEVLRGFGPGRSRLEPKGFGERSRLAAVTVATTTHQQRIGSYGRAVGSVKGEIVTASFQATICLETACAAAARALCRPRDRARRRRCASPPRQG